MLDIYKGGKDKEGREREVRREGAQPRTAAGNRAGKRGPWEPSSRGVANAEGPASSELRHTGGACLVSCNSVFPKPQCSDQMQEGRWLISTERGAEHTPSE